MLYIVNTGAAEALEKMTESVRRCRELDLHASTGWLDKSDSDGGTIVRDWGIPKDWQSVILQGAQIDVSNPFYQSPNPTMANHRDYSSVDLEALASNAIPITSFKPSVTPSIFGARFGQWGAREAREWFRIGWRTMADPEGERTLRPALLPSGVTHVDGMFSAGMPGDPIRLVHLQGLLSSLLYDFSIRSAPKSTIRLATINRLPLIPLEHPLSPALIFRSLRLNCLTDAYADVWREVFEASFTADAWALPTPRPGRPGLGDVGPEWTASTPLRIAEDRRNALVELDALVALMLGVTADQLCTVYRTQFAVLYGYDHNTYLYDANGRLVPNVVQVPWRKKGDATSVEERTATNQAGNTYTYELPFRFLDREADMRAAYAEFERRLRDRDVQGSRTR